MGPYVVTLLLVVASALFAWSMGSHYTGAVMGTAYGSGVLSMRRAQGLAALFALAGSYLASHRVIITYASTLVPRAIPLDIAAAQLSASLVTMMSTYFRLPTSTIQIYTFSLLGAAWVAKLPIEGAGVGHVVVFWAAGPLLATLVGYLLGRAGLPRLSERVVTGFVLIASVYSAFTLGSNDVSNAASSLVALHLLPVRMAGLYGGLFMLVGILTWGRPLLRRVGRDIIPSLNVPLAASAQLAQAIVMTGINAAGYNASLNQTIVGGLTGSGLATGANRLNWPVVRSIILNWTWSPVLGLLASAVMTVALRALFG